MKNLYDVVDAQRAALLSREYKAVRDIVRAYEVAERKVEASIRTFQRKIALAQKTGTPVSLAWYYQEARLENVLREIRLALEDYSKDALEFTSKARKNAYQLGAVHALRLGEASVIGDFSGLSKGAFENAQALLVAGSPLKALFDEIAPNGTTKAREVFAEAVAKGWNPRKTGEVLKARISGLSRDRAVLIARTEMIRSYRLANREVYSKNSDVLRGWRWTCAKTASTCVICLALDGEIYPTSEIIQSHPACRCSMVPLPNTDFGGPQPTKGEDFFRKLPAKDQDRLLGVKKGKLYREGKFGLKDNVVFQDSPEWGRSPRVRRVGDIEDLHSKGLLPSQVGPAKLSTYDPPPAQSLDDILTAAERMAVDPEQKALKAWEDVPTYSSGDKKPQFRTVKDSATKKLAKRTSDLPSTIEEVNLDDVTSTVRWIGSDKVKAYIRSGGDGADLPIIFRDGERLYVHDGDSLARLQAKKLLGQSKTSARIFDLADAKLADPLAELKGELKALGVREVETEGWAEQEAREALEWARERIKATGIVPPKVVLVDRMSYMVPSDGTMALAKNFRETSGLIRKSLQEATRDSLPAVKLDALRDLKAATVQASTDAAEVWEAEMIASKLMSETGLVSRANADLLEEWATSHYDLFSVKAFLGNAPSNAIRELVVLYRRGEYRLGSLPEPFESDVLKKLRALIGNKKTLPRYTEAEDFLFHQIGPQKGSNPGGLFVGRDGTKRYVKFYTDADKAGTEHLAAQLYREHGLNAPETVLFEHQGKTAIASKFVDGLRTLDIGVDSKEVLDGYALDAFLANWDVVGTKMDNILIDASGKAHRIDAGGSWFYRAKASDLKPERVTLGFDEWVSMGFDSRGQLTPFMRNAGFHNVDEAAEFLLEKGKALRKTLDKIGTTKADWEAWVTKKAPGLSREARRRVVEMAISRRKALDLKLAEAEDALKAAKAAKKRKGKPKKITLTTAHDWTNKKDLAKREADFIRAHGQAAYDQAKLDIASVLDRDTTILIRNERSDTLLAHFNGTDVDGGAPRFKSQHETKTSQGCLDPAYRVRKETILFSLLRTLTFGSFPSDPMDAPIYGFVYDRKLRMSGRNPASGYGDVSCVLKKSLRPRITATAGDSLGTSYVPRPIDDPGPEMFRSGVSPRELSDFKRYGLENIGSYFEIQVHGRLRISDVEEFIVSSQATANKLKALAAKYGIKITVI